MFMRLRVCVSLWLPTLKKHSLIQAYLCHPVPHRCGDREAYRVNGRMCADSSGSEKERQVRLHGASSIPFSTLGLKEKD